MATATKMVKCIENGMVYKSIDEAALCMSVSYVDLSAVLAGKRMTAGGYHWVPVYSDDPFMRQCAMINCANSPGSAFCNRCGWGPEEHDRRVHMIYNGGMKVNKEGKRYLCLREKKEETDELS